MLRGLYAFRTHRMVRSAWQFARASPVRRRKQEQLWRMSNAFFRWHLHLTRKEHRMRPTRKSHASLTSEALEAELDILKRQQRALQLVTAARQVYNLLGTGLRFMTVRWFMRWHTNVIKQNAVRRASKSQEYQIAMEKQLSFMTRCLCLSRIMSIELHRTHCIVQRWHHHTTVAMLCEQSKLKANLLTQLREGSAQQDALKKELAQLRRHLRQLESELEQVQLGHAQEVSQPIPFNVTRGVLSGPIDAFNITRGVLSCPI